MYRHYFTHTYISFPNWSLYAKSILKHVTARALVYYDIYSFLHFSLITARVNDFGHFEKYSLPHFSSLASSSIFQRSFHDIHTFRFLHCWFGLAGHFHFLSRFHFIPNVSKLRYDSSHFIKFLFNTTRFGSFYHLKFFKYVIYQKCFR